MMQGHDPPSTEVNEKCTLVLTVQKECLQKKKLNASKIVDFLSNIWPHLPQVSVVSIK